MIYRDRFIVYIKSEDIYVDLAEDAETRFGASNNEVNRAPHIGKKNKFVDER